MFLKTQLWFLNHLIKWNGCQMEGFAPLFHSGDKGFTAFKKRRSPLVYLKDKFSFLNQVLKWKDYQVEPIGVASLFSLKRFKPMDRNLVVKPFEKKLKISARFYSL